MSAAGAASASVVAVRELGSTDVEEWTELERHALVRNPFFGPDCVMPAATLLAADSHLRVVRWRGPGSLCALMPIQVIRSRRVGVAVSVAHTRGLSTAVGLGTPLVAGAPVDEALAGLVDGLLAWAREGGPQVAVLDWFDEQHAGMGATLREVCEDRRVPLWTERTWERPTTSEGDRPMSIEGALSSTRRYELRRRERRLEEELGGPVEVVDRAGDESAVEDFLNLEASGWKASEGDAYLLSPERADWFRAICGNFSRSGRLHLLSLCVGDRAVAMQCHLRQGPETFLLRLAHDASLDRLGLGVLLHVRAVGYLAERGVEVVDTCASPDNPFLGELYTGRRRLSTFVLGTGGLLARSMVRLGAARAAARS